MEKLKDDIELKLKNTVLIGKENGYITITMNKPASQKQAPGLSMWLNHIKANKNPLALPVAIDTNGQPQFVELFTESHLLVGGGSGSGKTTWLYSVVLDLAMANSPDDLEMLVVDGKESDLAILNPLPHLVMDVLMDNTKVGIALDYIENEIANRKRMVREGKLNPKPLLFLIDEIDAILPKNPNLMDRVIQISGQARSFNILMIITAKRVVKKFVDKAITDNFLARLCLMVPDMEASQNILGSSYTQGAELTGKGDLFFKAGPLMRGQGYLIDEKHKGEASKMVKKITRMYPAINRKPLGDDGDDVIEGKCMEPLDEGFDLFIPLKRGQKVINLSSYNGRTAADTRTDSRTGTDTQEPLEIAKRIAADGDRDGQMDGRTPPKVYEIGGYAGTDADGRTADSTDVISKIIALHKENKGSRVIAPIVGMCKTKVAEIIKEYEAGLRETDEG